MESTTRRTGDASRPRITKERPPVDAAATSQPSSEFAKESEPKPLSVKQKIGIIVDTMRGKLEQIRALRMELTVLRNELEEFIPVGAIQVIMAGLQNGTQETLTVPSRLNLWREIFVGNPTLEELTEYAKKAGGPIQWAISQGEPSDGNWLKIIINKYKEKKKGHLTKDYKTNGVGSSTMGRAEKETFNTKPKTLRPICDALGITIDDIKAFIAFDPSGIINDKKLYRTIILLGDALSLPSENQ